MAGLREAGSVHRGICESCLPPFCWCTHPTALAATINKHLGGGVAAVSTDASEDTITARAIASIDDLENIGRDYYLVDFLTGDRSTARMVIDARVPTAAEYAGIDRTDDELPRFVPPEDVLRTADRRTAAYRDRASLTIDARAVNQPPTLVWKACDQSHSAFLPFYRIQQDHAVMYLRADGVLFRKLTTSGAGA